MVVVASGNYPADGGWELGQNDGERWNGSKRRASPFDPLIRFNLANFWPSGPRRKLNYNGSRLERVARGAIATSKEKEFNRD